MRWDLKGKQELGRQSGKSTPTEGAAGLDHEAGKGLASSRK